MPDQHPSRFRLASDYINRVPVHVVWEITLACDLKCRHCGSRAGKRRPRELSTGECLNVVAELGRLGTRELTLIGGEAYLRKDWTDIIAAAKAEGMYCAIQTGARNLTPERLNDAIAAGLDGVGISIDGLPPLHDDIRGIPGSYAAAIDAAARVKDAGLNVSVNTQIGPRTMEDLPELCDTLLDLQITHWQLQLTVAMGNAVDNDDCLLQPYELLTLIPLLAGLHEYAEDRGMVVAVGNNIGYFGPHEHLFRGYAEATPHWSGCGAGDTVIGIEADGKIKGCPSLESTRFLAGNIRDDGIVRTWKDRNVVPFPHEVSERPLWGFCSTCYYADVCGGGCNWTADSLFGRPGNNPYCHHRALVLEAQGLRERIRKLGEAGPAPFSIGRFELILEQISDKSIVEITQGEPADHTRSDQPSPPPQNTSPPTRRGPPESLELCRSCYHFVKNSETRCPFCDADIAEERNRYEADTKRRERIMADVLSTMEKGWK